MSIGVLVHEARHNSNIIVQSAVTRSTVAPKIGSRLAQCKWSRTLNRNCCDTLSNEARNGQATPRHWDHMKLASRKIIVTRDSVTWGLATSTPVKGLQR